MNNAIFSIHPYKHKGLWVFDDERVGLDKEPFVSGADEIIDVMVRDIPNAEDGFNILFSQEPFPGCNLVLEWNREELTGNWYYSKELDMQGWLCPALFLYFDGAPAYLYTQFRAA